MKIFRKFFASTEKFTNIVKIRKNMTGIVINCMNFGCLLSLEFAIYGKNICIDILIIEVYNSQLFELSDATVRNHLSF